MPLGSRAHAGASQSPESQAVGDHGGGRGDLCSATGAAQPPSQWCGEGSRHLIWPCRHFSILLQEFARYYLAKKPSRSPTHELETKAELLQPGKPQHLAEEVGYPEEA